MYARSKTKCLWLRKWVVWGSKKGGERVVLAVNSEHGTKPLTNSRAINLKVKSLVYFHVTTLSEVIFLLHTI